LPYDVKTRSRPARATRAHRTGPSLPGRNTERNTERNTGRDTSGGAPPSRVILLNKPFRVMCQFRASDDRPTLANFVSVPDVYPAGRLDFDSEGLVVLTNDGQVQHGLANPKMRTTKVYLAQVEGLPDTDALTALTAGVVIDGQPTRPAKATIVGEPTWLWDREPPIRYRAAIPTTWLEIHLQQGRNRQVRRMTAAVGHPTLRLIRTRVGPYELASLSPGQWREVPVQR
jgi:23S rRNA pseudouridine2457 synthase